MTRLEKFFLTASIVGLVADAIALATFGATFWGITPPPTSILAMALGGVVVLLLWTGCLLTFRRVSRSVVVDSTGRPITRRPSPHLRRAALAGIVGIPLIALFALAGWAAYQWQSPEEIIVLVTEIDGPDPEHYRVTENILNNLRSELASIENARVDYLPRPVSEGEGADVARALGTRPFGSRDDATIVIWGWYGPTATHIQVALRFEVLRQPPLTPPIETGEPRVYEIAELDSFALQTELSEEMTYLSAFVAGMAHYGLEEYQAAQRSFTIALSQPESSIRSVGREIVLFHRANVCSYQRLHDQAIADFTEAIGIDPNFMAAYINRGNAHVALKKYDEAIANYTQAIGIDSDFAPAYYNRGNAHVQLEEYEQAITDYTQAIDIDPNCAEAYSNRCVAYRRLGEYDEAIADCEKAIDIDPKFAMAYNNRGLVYAKLKQYDQAIADYNKAIDIDPNLAPAYSNRCNDYLRLKEYDQAIADCGKAIDIDPNFAPAYNNRGNAHADLKEYDEAIADYTAAINIEPDFALPYYNQGVVHVQLEEYEQAIAYFTEAIRIDPGFAGAYYNRGLSHYYLGEYEQAIADFESYLLLALPDDPFRTRAQQYIEELQEQR